MSEAISPFLDNLDSNSPDLQSNSPDLTENSPDLKTKLTSILQSFGYSEMPGKISSENMRKIILEICEDVFLSLKDLANLLERDPKALQDQYLTPMLAEGFMELKYPDVKNHPGQAYRSKK